MRSSYLFLAMSIALSACSDYTPHEKKAVYDVKSGALVFPAPCPDWSSSASNNDNNAPHSNYGCAVENNLAVQLEDPKDLARGRGTDGPDSDTAIRVIQQYKAGQLPIPLTPQQQGPTQ